MLTFRAVPVKIRRVDANQTEAVAALRSLGLSVQSLATVGHGVPDLVIGGVRRCPCCLTLLPFNTLAEVKDGARKPSEQKLTDDERDWHAEWRGERPRIITGIDVAILVARAPIDATRGRP